MHQPSLTPSPKPSHQTGFTLLELLLYAAIVGSLLISISYFFATVADSRVKNQTIAEVDQQGRFMMDTMLQTIRNASGINSPSAGANSNSLSVTVPLSGNSPTVYSLSGSSLQIKEGANTPVLLSNSNVSISNLTFTNLTRPGTNGIVQVSITLNRVNTLSRNEYDYQQTFVGSAELKW